MTDNKQRRTEALAELNRSLARGEAAKKRRSILTAAGAVVVVAALGASVFYLAAPSGNEQDLASETTTSPLEAEELTVVPAARAEALPETVTCDYPATTEAAREVSTPATEDISTVGTVTVTLATGAGDIDMTLDRALSPCTVNAIEHLASEGYYDDTVCHRITTSGIFVLQCGDPSGTGAGGPGFSFANEFPTDQPDAAGALTAWTYPRGSIAMANAGVDTNGSQFFLNFQDSPLAPNYTVFGQIGETGLATLDAIAEKGAEGGSADGTPAEEVRISTATVS